MSSLLQRFRTYEIAEDPAGASLELWRTDREVVCLASQPADRRWVELHVLAGVDTQDPAMRPVMEGFRSQVQALLRLRDRRVLEIFEAGEDEGALFYVSEFVDGEALDGYLARCTPVPAWWAVEVARQLTLGLLALRATPAVLARTQVFNARLTLEGDGTTDALVKLADFDLGGPVSHTVPAAATAEARAVQEVGRLLCYALTGLVAEQITPRQIFGLPLPPEVVDLLSRLTIRHGRSSPVDLPGLLAALTACGQSPALSAAPARLPPTLRPRLPLAAHFPTLPRLATELGDRLRLERSAFDAAQPYSQRAFAGAIPVTIQLLPPARLMSPVFLLLIRQAADRAAARPTPHVLRVLELPSFDDPGWFLEEGPPRLSLDRVRRLRGTLTAAEAAYLLRECDKAVLALETRGLTPVVLSPHDVFLDMAESATGPPGDDELAARLVTAWPEFKMKMRAHPVTTQLAQPKRFLRERLLDPPPLRSATAPASGASAGLQAPTAADYATLFAWMCGGLTTLPAELAPLINDALTGPTPPSRAAVVDAVAPLIPRPPKPAAKSKSATTSRKRDGTEPGKPGPKSRRAKAAAKKSDPSKSPAIRPTPPHPAEAQTGDFAPDRTPAGSLDPESMQLWESEGGPPSEPEPGGFAEVLLGTSTGHGLLDPSPEAYFRPDEDSEDLTRDEFPVGALFGNWPGTGTDDELPSSTENRPFDGAPGRSENHSPGLGRLLVLIVVVALAIAALMAHVTGLAPWR